jgi:hypothetical protein
LNFGVWRMLSAVLWLKSMEHFNIKLAMLLPQGTKNVYRSSQSLSALPTYDAGLGVPEWVSGKRFLLLGLLIAGYGSAHLAGAAADWRVKRQEIADPESTRWRREPNWSI